MDKVGDDKSGAMDIMQMAVKNRKDMNPGEYAWFIQEATKRLDREKKGLKGLDSATQAFVNSVNGIKGFVESIVSPNKVADNVSQLISRLFEKVQGGKEPKVAEEEIVKEQIDQQLSNLNSEKKVNVKRKSDGATGSMLEKDFNGSIYERLE